MGHELGNATHIESLIASSVLSTPNFTLLAKKLEQNVFSSLFLDYLGEIESHLKKCGNLHVNYSARASASNF